MGEKEIDLGKPQPDIIIDPEQPTPEMRQRLEDRVRELMDADGKLSRGEALRIAGKEIIEQARGKEK